MDINHGIINKIFIEIIKNTKIMSPYYSILKFL